MTETRKNELFEIHISVDPTQVCELKLYCMKHDIKYLLACSLYGVNRNQLMSSAWYTGTSEGAIEHAKKLAVDMTENANIRIERVKVEAMFSNSCVPREADENYSAREHYFEFHAKVNFTASELDRLEKVCDLMRDSDYCKCAVSFNAFTNKPCAIVTLRVLGNLGGDNALKEYEKLDEKLKAEKFEVCSVQREFSIYDTNVNYDDGWL